MGIKTKLIIGIAMFVLMAAVIFWGGGIFLFIFQKGNVTVLQEKHVDGFSIILYEVDVGAMGAKTVILSIGTKVKTSTRGNIYVATLPEKSKTYFDFDEEHSVLHIYIDERKEEIIKHETYFKNINIVYH